MPMILNEEQNMLKDSARDFCTNQAPIRQFRKIRDEKNPDGFDRATWQKMVELGWAGIPWAEEHGGLAFGYKGLGVVTEETGRTLLASPLYATVWVGGTLVNIGGSAAQKAALLPQVASGELPPARATASHSMARRVSCSTPRWQTSSSLLPARPVRREPATALPCSWWIARRRV